MHDFTVEVVEPACDGFLNSGLSTQVRPEFKLSWKQQGGKLRGVITQTSPYSRCAERFVAVEYSCQ
ncbi:MAG: hypothetical protein ACRD9S_13710 [Pyrinomonadaceae bacterium]